jgi:hypothetical protein
MKTASDLTRSVRELVAQSTIRNGNAVVDEGSRWARLLAGLEAHVIQECRLGKVSFHDIAGVMNAFPPANEVQQVVSVGSQSRVR